MSKVVIPYIYEGNLMERMDCGTFDCAMSVEVAEHLLPENSSVAVDNLVRASTKHVFFTAAPPGQGGTGHINEQPRDFWIDLFEQHGMRYLPHEVKRIQDTLIYKMVPVRKYMRRNVFFFEKVNG
jgi:hypothetical protein